MSLPATDAFTGSDGTTLTAYSASWSYAVLVGTALRLFSNSLRPDTTDDSVAFWNADSFNADQYAQATFVAISGIYMGCGVRANATSGGNGYYTVINNGAEYLNKYVNGSATNISNYGLPQYVTNDVHRLEVSGTTITPKRNGSTDLLGQQTDNALSSGSAGISGSGTASTATRLDDWEGGNIGGGPVAKSVSDSGAALESASITASFSIPDLSTVTESLTIKIVPPVGSVCWGQITGVTQTNKRTFINNWDGVSWDGTGSIENSGDAERMALYSGQYMDSEIINTGANKVTLLFNQYQPGDTPASVLYRTHSDPDIIKFAGWQSYTGQFTSLGYVQFEVWG